MRHMLPRLMCALCSLLILAIPGANAAQVKFGNVSVHDPAVLRTEDGHYYIYGSHLQAAWSDDLVTWKQFSRLERAALQPDYATEFSEALSFARTSTFWAPDVIRLADGRYYMYYCCCEGSSPRSALGLAVSDSPEGPFEHVAILVKSGDGYYDATRYPNAIDPCVFFDGAGERLYMVYGSYSGGIFLLELDPTTGLTLEGQSQYGVRLLGGNHACIEGPYIVYNPSTDYYYLFLSFGGLGVNDGYNIRVCRSRNVEGPYEDAAGHSMLDCKCKPGHYWNNDDIAPYGTKLMGGCLFEPLEGENSRRRSALRSPGHNSVYHDAGEERWFIIHHTRFASTGERYVTQVRELFFNDAGWPMIAPTRYVPGELVEGELRLDGAFKLLRHGRDVNTVEHVSVAATLSGDGGITGGAEGGFAAEGDSIELTLDGVTYRGRAYVGYDEVQDAFVTCLTALSGDGEALWGMRATGQD